MYWQRAYHIKRIFINGLWLASGVAITFLYLSFSKQKPSLSLFESAIERSPEDSLQSLFQNQTNYYSSGFDFPVGKPDAKGYYNAQGFRKNNHLGDDWNGNGGGNTDLGDAIYSVSEGVVLETVNYYGGWGNVTRVAHAIKGNWKIEQGKLVSDASSSTNSIIVESMYAHSKSVLVKQGDWVKRGQQIATIGTGEGKYPAHLHLELREHAGMPLGAGYSSNTEGYMDPTAFIKQNRKF
jgi:murein DD-endopeptidase MepM/ murein hydrolase activator NlpD